MQRIRDKFDDFFDTLFGKVGKRTRLMLQRFGDVPIVKIEVKRSPIQKAVNILMDAITFKRFTPAKKALNYDKLYHLRLIVHLNNGAALLVEKNETISVELAPRTDSVDTETLSMPIRAHLTLNMMFQRAIQRVGEERIYKYDAFKWNCQLFVIDLLLHSWLLNNEWRAWIMQDVAKLIAKLPAYTNFLSRLSTDVASYVRRVFEHMRYKKGGVVKKQPQSAVNASKHLETGQWERKLYGGDVGPKRRVRDYSVNGGKVQVENPDEHERQNRDTIPAILVRGEMVIPKTYKGKPLVPIVERFLRENNIILPGMEK